MWAWAVVASAQDAPVAAPAEPAPAECFPECRSGYLCHLGECVSRCNPPCEAGTVCTDAGECSPTSAAVEPAPVVAAAPGGTVCVRRAAGMSGWAVPLVVRDNGEVLWKFQVGQQKCFPVAAGPHEIGALYWAKMDVSATRPAATQALDVTESSCHYYKVIMGFWGVLLRVSDESRFAPDARCGAAPG